MERKQTDTVLFIHGDQLKGAPIKELLEESEELQELVVNNEILYLIIVFNNEVKDRSQVRELLDKIRNITETNGGIHYTNEMFKEAERELEEEKQRILKEREEDNTQTGRGTGKENSEKV